MLNYFELKPALHLQPYIRKFWVLDNSLSAWSTDIKYALPNTCFTLVFIKGNGALIDYPEASHKIRKGIYIAGQITNRTGIRILPHTQAFMVQLNACSASLLTKCPFYQLTNQFIEVTDINKYLGLLLAEIDVPDNYELKQRLEKVLGRVFYQSKTSKLISGCFDYLVKYTQGDSIAITFLAGQAGYSVRGLEKQFKQHVGLSPKQVYTIMKVRSVVDDILLPHGNVSLTALAYRYGYNDQAHFIKTFKCIMDSSPGKFNKQQHILPLQR